MATRMLNIQEIAALRREIEGIHELNVIYRSQKHHTFQAKAAMEQRKVRLEEIQQQLVDSTRAGADVWAECQPQIQRS